MTGEPPSEVLGSLPRTRPHRRSQKRPPRVVDAGADAQFGAKPAKVQPATAKTAGPRPTTPRPEAKTTGPRPVTPRPKPTRLRQPAQPAGTPPGPRARPPATSSGSDLLGTAVQAAAELAEIGLSVGARAIRGAVARLPRP
jgi:hypothetical protein